MHDREFRRFWRHYEAYWDFSNLSILKHFKREFNSIELIESILFNIQINWIYLNQHLNQLNHFKMIESIWNNIQINWLQSGKKNNNFQTLRTVRVSLTVKNWVKNSWKCWGFCTFLLLWIPGEKCLKLKPCQSWIFWQKFDFRIVCVEIAELLILIFTRVIRVYVAKQKIWC